MEPVSTQILGQISAQFNILQLDSALESIDNDESVRVVIFTGGLPGVFIRHFSIEEITAMSDELKNHRSKGLPHPRFSRTALRLVHHAAVGNLFNIGTCACSVAIYS